MTEKAIDQVEVGFKASFSKMITEASIRSFAELSGDYNQLHLDEDYARRTIFGERIAHGMLAVSLISAALARLPGVSVYLSQSVKFKRPVKIGDVIEAVVEVIEKSQGKGVVRLKTYCQNQRGEQILDGEARVKLFDLR